MKKYSKKSQIKRIQKFFNEIDWMFQINGFDKEIIFKEQDEMGGKSNKQAEIIFWEDYQQITVNIFPSFLEYELKTQRKMLLHELCHTITLPSKSLAFDLLDGKLMTPERIREVNEMATSKLENLLNHLLQGNLKYAQKAYKNYLK